MCQLIPHCASRDLYFKIKKVHIVCKEWWTLSSQEKNIDFYRQYLLINQTIGQIRERFSLCVFQSPMACRVTCYCVTCGRRAPPFVMKIQVMNKMTMGILECLGFNPFLPVRSFGSWTWSLLKLDSLIPWPNHTIFTTSLRHVVFAIWRHSKRSLRFFWALKLRNFNKQLILIRF